MPGAFEASAEFDHDPLTTAEEIHRRWFDTTFPADAGRLRTQMILNRKGTAMEVDAILPAVHGSPSPGPLAFLGGLGVAGLIDHQAPEPPFGARGAEVLEVEREDRQAVTLGDRHDRSVGHSEVQVGEARVDRDGTAQQPRRQVGHIVLAGVQRREEQARSVRADPGAQQLIDLDNHGRWHDQPASQASHELGGETVSLIASVGSRDQRPGVGDDPQRAEMRSVR